MTVRQTRLLIKATAASLCLGAAGVGYSAWRSGDLPLTSGASESTAGRRDVNVETTPTQTLDDFANLWSRPLRSPLYDPPPPTPVVKPKPVVVDRPKPVKKPKPPSSPPKLAPLNVRLVGTILEADRSVAIITDQAGTIDLKGVGETLELQPAGISIKTIAAETVTVSHQGRQSTLKMQSSAPSKKRNRR